jgi:hypothetical protein
MDDCRSDGPASGFWFASKVLAGQSEARPYSCTAELCEVVLSFWNSLSHRPFEPKTCLFSIWFAGEAAAQVAA